MAEIAMKPGASFRTRCLSVPLLIATAMLLPGEILPACGNLALQDSPLNSSGSPSGATDATQTSPSTAITLEPFEVATYCEAIAIRGPHSAALASVCKYALLLRRNLPDIICDQETRRYQQGQLGGDFDLEDVITAKVRYENGQEQYSQITVNGRPDSSVQSGVSGAWSEGEFATALRSIFLPQSSATFTFRKRDVLRSTHVLVFDFEIQRKNNRSWYLFSAGKTSYPGYRGRLWVKQSNFHLLRMEKKVVDAGADFPIQQVSTVINYAEIPLADGTEFVLPVESNTVTCPSVAALGCWHNRLTFKNWHKFVARARILAEGESSSPSTKPEPVQPMPDIASLASETRERQVELARLAGLMLTDESAVIEKEWKQASLASASRKIEEIRSPAEGQPQMPARSAATQEAMNRPPEMPASESLATLKVDVRLVLVPVVVRDSQGQPVSGLRRENFQLFDNRKPQLITQFFVQQPGSAVSTQTLEPGQPSREKPAPAGRAIAYVFDDVHTDLHDLIRARDAAARQLASLRPTDRAAIFTTSGKTFANFSGDRAKLQEALRQLRPHPLTATGSIRCPDMSYAQADLIQNQNDAAALERATQDAVACAYGGDGSARAFARRLTQDTAARVLVVGHAESQVSFNILREVVQRISAIPGQRSVLMVSPGFPLAEMQQELSEILETALHSEVVINALDPGGVSLNSSIEPGSASTPADVLADLTGGTGGAFFRNKNDLDEGFRRTASPDYFYVLGFSPQTLDGKFHTLKVTLQHSPKLSLQARRGYHALKPTTPE